MNHPQKVVAAGAASGILSMALSVWALTCFLTPPVIVDTIGDRLAYALGANVFAIIPFFIMLIAVGNARFLSDAIDPTQHKENMKIEIDGRVADNTLQQNFVFFVATMALSTVVSLQYLQVIWALAIVYVIARCVFWAGYRLHPLYRAPGMAATSYLNVGVIVYTLFKLI